MWMCNECGNLFRDEDLETRNDEYGRYKVCSHCGSDELEEVRPCKLCGEYTTDYDYCEECRAEFKLRFMLVTKAWMEHFDVSEEMALDQIDIGWNSYV